MPHSWPYFGEQLGVVIWNAVQGCIAKRAFQLALAIDWTASKGREEVEIGGDYWFHQRQQREFLGRKELNQTKASSYADTSCRPY